LIREARDARRVREDFRIERRRQARAREVEGHQARRVRIRIDHRRVARACVGQRILLVAVTTPQKQSEYCDPECFHRRTITSDRVMRFGG
jgi:hypothetical protein